MTTCWTCSVVVCVCVRACGWWADWEKWTVMGPRYARIGT